jgi:hypothetical protein
MARALLALVFTIVLAAGWARPAQAEEAVVGKPHPEIHLPTIDGEGSLSLHAQRGTKVLLIQFASW